MLKDFFDKKGIKLFVIDYRFNFKQQNPIMKRDFFCQENVKFLKNVQK